MTTNERFSRRNDGENNSTISRSMLEAQSPDNPSNLLTTNSNDDTFLRTTFMGPSNGN